MLGLLVFWLFTNHEICYWMKFSLDCAIDGDKNSGLKSWNPQ